VAAAGLAWPDRRRTVATVMWFMPGCCADASKLFLEDRACRTAQSRLSSLLFHIAAYPKAQDAVCRPYDTLCKSCS
jgi:hypothetical protein